MKSTTLENLEKFRLLNELDRHEYDEGVKWFYDHMYDIIIQFNMISKEKIFQIFEAEYLSKLKPSSFACGVYDEFVLVLNSTVN